MLDYVSDCPTFSLAFSPLSTTTASLRLAVGSLVESRSDTNANANNVTIAALDPAFLDLEDDPDDGLGSGGSSSSASSGADTHVGGDTVDYEEPSYARSRTTGRSVRTGSAFRSIARAPHPYPPSHVEFSPAKLSASLQSSSAGTLAETTREMVATSSECLRLWDLVDDDSSASGGPRSGFVGEGRNGQGCKLVQRAALANVRLRRRDPRD